MQVGSEWDGGKSFQTFKLSEFVVRGRTTCVFMVSLRSTLKHPLPRATRIARRCAGQTASTAQAVHRYSALESLELLTEKTAGHAWESEHPLRLLYLCSLLLQFNQAASLPLPRPESVKRNHTQSSGREKPRRRANKTRRNQDFAGRGRGLLRASGDPMGSSIPTGIPPISIGELFRCSRQKTKRCLPKYICIGVGLSVVQSGARLLDHSLETVIVKGSGLLTCLVHLDLEQEVAKGRMRV